VDRKVGGFGRSRFAEEEISSLDFSVMNQMRTICLEVPTEVKTIYTLIGGLILEVKLVEDARWFIDTLNRLQNLKKVILMLPVGYHTHLPMSEEEVRTRILDQYDPLKNLRGVDVVIEVVVSAPYKAYCTQV
jgi:hypothetical protein